MSKIHEIKTGLDITRYSLSIYENSLPWDMNPFWDAYNYKPLVVAGYVQDRADFEDLVVRAGIRLDYLDSKAKVRAFPESLGAQPKIADSLLMVPAKYRLAPRLGLSYPITERIKFRFSYGHFYKNPSFSDLYTYADRSAAELRSRGNVIVGNADMGAEKTIAYEMGFDAQLTDVFAFDVTAFYKDVFDLAGVRTVHALPQPYTMYYNVEYARIQGFEATMTKALNQYWSSHVGYTFQIAKGTASTAETQYQRSTPRLPYRPGRAPFVPRRPGLLVPVRLHFRTDAGLRGFRRVHLQHGHALHADRPEGQPDRALELRPAAEHLHA